MSAGPTTKPEPTSGSSVTSGLSMPPGKLCPRHSADIGGMPISGTASGIPRSGRSALELWARAEHLSRAERLDRARRGPRSRRRVRPQRVRGRGLGVLQNELARYGLAVIGAWLRRGAMRVKCAEKRIQATDLPTWAREDPMTVGSVACETVADAIIRFRDDVLIPGVWDATKGASLRTFFIGQCMRRYPNAYQRWSRHELPQASDDPEQELEVVAHLGQVCGVEDDVIRSHTASLILRGASIERAARALALGACGYPNSAIAADLGNQRRRRRQHAEARTGPASTRTERTTEAEGVSVSNIEKKVAKSSFGSRSAAAARASVSRQAAAKVMSRSQQMRDEKVWECLAPK